MKKLIAVSTAATLVALSLSAPVDAKRLGGGRSVGKQTPPTMQREAAPQAPAAPSAAPQAPAAQPSPGLRQPAPAAAAAAQPARNRWLAPLAGIAAGLGLAALAHSLGFGEGLASFLLVALLAVAALVVVRMLLARRSAANPQGARPAYAGYSPDRLGGEAQPGGWSSARDGAAGATASTTTRSAFDQPAGAAAAGAAGLGAGALASAGSAPGVPAGFDTEAFLRNAKVQFVRLQAAFDAANLNDLREFTTPSMFGELKVEIDERNGARNVTEVVTLNAELLGVETEAAEHVASVRFTGLIREREGAAPEPFDEVWNLTKPVDGSAGWVLAGIQQLA